MSSRSSQNRLRRKLEIRRHNFPAEFSCDLCLVEGEACYIMPDQPNKSCAHCAGRGRPCITTSWESLDRARDDLGVKISQDEKARELLLEQLNSIQMRLVRNRKIKENKEREAADKLRCLEEEMSAGGEELGRVVQDPLSTEECLAAWGVESPFKWFDVSGDPVSNMPVADGFAGSSRAS